MSRESAAATPARWDDGGVQVNREIGYRTSRQQRDLWAVAGPARVPQVALVVPWPQSCPDLADARHRLAALVASHEVLRSRVELPAAFAEPLQVVEPADGSDASTGVIELAEVDPLDGRSGHSLQLVGPATVVDAATLQRLADLVAGAADVEDPVQYSEYAEWQEELSGDVPATAAAWWAATAARVATRPMPSVAAVPPVDPVTVVLRLPIAATDREARALAVLAAAASRLSGDTEVVLGTEIDPRTSGGQLDGALGPFAAVVPVAVTVADDVSLDSLTHEVAPALARARQFAEWEPRDPGLPDAARPVVVLGVAPRTAVVPRPGVAVELRLDPATGELAVLVTDPGLAVGWAAAIEAVLAAPGVAVAAVEIVPVAGSTDLSGPPVTTVASVVAAIAAHVGARPNSPALRQGDVVLSYAELAGAVSTVVAQLTARVAPDAGRVDAPVAVVADRSVATVVAVLAALVAGVPYVAVPPDHPPVRLARVLRDAGAVRVLAGAGRDLGGVADVPGLAVVRVDPSVRSPQPWPVTPPLSTDAYLLFTSGSTGTPKGVAVTHANLAHYVASFVEALAPDDDLCWALLTTPATDLGNTALFGAFVTGGTLVVLDDDEVLDGRRFGAAVDAYGLDAAKLTPSHLAGLLASGAQAVPARLLVVGGEALSWRLVDQARELGVARVVNHYGPTETTVGAVFHETGPADRRAGSSVPIGRPLPGVRVTVRTVAGARVPVGAVGELWIGGPGVARYLDDGLAAAFVTDPAEPGGRLYRTGDLVREDADGRLVFLGRRDGQVKIRGHRVETGEVEAALLAHVGVQRAAVVARPGPDGAPRLDGYLVCHFHPSPTADELREFVRTRLPGHMVPDTFTELDALPLTGNGKLDAAALPEPDAGERRSVSAPPATPTEELVSEVYAELLDTPRPGRDDDFFRLGGHSLLATQAVVEVRRRTGVDLPVHAIFLAQTVAALAAEIDRLASERDGEPDLPPDHAHRPVPDPGPRRTGDDGST